MFDRRELYRYSGGYQGPQTSLWFFLCCQKHRLLVRCGSCFHPVKPAARLIERRAGIFLWQESLSTRCPVPKLNQKIKVPFVRWLSADRYTYEERRASYLARGTLFSEAKCSAFH
ncbi:hypothetical protein CSUI_007428 [Cystoisospora suis]|uniref:Uncharacterized protein n=1 Tax=Cystoisospora suis TaxID=483139 RepID=A0A2C6KQM8_9APIC|nr:hypothetical protein CSUI_007428 [Cystoisospora suis]